MIESFVSTEAGSIVIILLIFFWTLPWKGLALWRAAKNCDKVWFIVILILNTLALLDILYFFIFSKIKKNEDNEEFEKTRETKKIRPRQV